MVGELGFSNFTPKSQRMDLAASQSLCQGEKMLVACYLIIFLRKIGIFKHSKF
jgi:hypothetical protein